MEIKNEIERLVSEFRTRLSNAKSRTNYPKSKIMAVEMKLGYFEELLETQRTNQPVVWQHWSVPSEVMIALRLAQFGSEQFSIQLVNTDPKVALRYIDTALRHGIGEEVCSPHQCTIGLVLAGQLNPPTAVISSTAPCDSQAMMNEVVSYLTQRPTFRHYLPMVRWDESDEELMPFYLKQLREMIEFLERVTNRRMDYARLSEVAEISRQTEHYHVKIQQELRARIPAALTGREGISFFGVLSHKWGTPGLLDYYKQFYEERSGMVEGSESPLVPKKLRIACAGALPYWEPFFLDWIEKEHNAEVVLDLNNLLGESPIEPNPDPLQIIAGRVFRLQGFIGVSNFAKGYQERLLRQCQKFKIDAFIILVHKGCCNMGGLSQSIRTFLRQEMGIPTLVLHTDPVDNRSSTIPEQKKQITRFLNFVSVGAV